MISGFPYKAFAPCKLVLQRRIYKRVAGMTCDVIGVTSSYTCCSAECTVVFVTIYYCVIYGSVNICWDKNMFYSDGDHEMTPRA